MHSNVGGLNRAADGSYDAIEAHHDAPVFACRLEEES
jgi:hypothetical protein